MAESPTLECKNIVKRRKEANLPVYDCGLGSNVLKPPPVFYELIRAYASQYQYSSVHGEPPLQSVLKKYFSSDQYTVEHTLVGHGLKEILFCFHSAFLGTIFHVVPKWVSYGEQAEICNTTIVNIMVDPKTMKINAKQLEKSLIHGNHVRALLFNNPVNPTGIYYTEEEIKEIAMVCKRTNTVIFADEIYMNLQHDGTFTSISKYAPELTIRASSISKDFAAGGYRLGWALFPEELNYLWKNMVQVGSAIYSCVNPVVQLATADLLTLNHSDYMKTQRVYFKKYMQKAIDILKDTPLNFVKPNAAWYIFVDFSPIIGKIERGTSLQNFLTENLGIVCLGGEHFGYSYDFIRFSIKNENSIEGMRVLKKYIKSL